MKSPLRQSPKFFRDYLLFVLAPASLFVAAILLFFYFLGRPGPPRTIVMTAGSKGGAYLAYAERYRELLAREGITLEILPSGGSLENLERLTGHGARVDIGFVQGGAAKGFDLSGLVSLGDLYREPLWVFAREAVPIKRNKDLRGKRLAVGAPGSGTRKVVLELLAANGVDGSTAKLFELGGSAAAVALKGGEADVAFFFASPDAPVVQDLIRTKGIRLLDFPQAEAYPIHFPFLSVARLPAGGIDLAEDIPPRNVVLLADMAQLVARESLHPAIIGPLLEAAKKVHGGPGVFELAGEFPAPREGDIPMSEDAIRYYKSGLPFLYRHLPFRAASLATRAALMLIPVLGILVPLMKFVPPVYRWRMRSRIYRWYGDLMALESDVLQDPDPARRSEYLDRLSWIDGQIDNTRPPLSFAQERYAFRMHIETVRARIREIQEHEGAGGDAQAR
jgi:TRAP transporter TAXI family solute receptor